MVKGVDHPVAVFPNDAKRIGAVAGGISVARHIEPKPRPPFTVSRPGQQVVNEQFISVCPFVVHECLDLGQGRGQPGQVKRQPADQDMALCLWARPIPGCLQSGKDKLINTVPHPHAFDNPGQNRPNRWAERPVPGVGRALVNPFADDFNLRLIQLVTGVLRRHPVVGIVGGDAEEQLAFAPVAGSNRGDVLALTQGAFADVEPKTGFAGLLVRAVAGKAVQRQQRPDIAIIIHIRARCRMTKSKQPGNTNQPTEQSVSHPRANARAIATPRTAAAPPLFSIKTQRLLPWTNEMTFKKANPKLYVPPPSRLGPV